MSVTWDKPVPEERFINLLLADAAYTTEDEKVPYDPFATFVKTIKKKSPDTTIAELFALTPNYDEVIAFIYKDYKIHLWS